MIDSPVTRTPGVCGGRPCVAGTRIRVETLVEDFMVGMGHAELADAYNLTVEQVEGALRWHANGGDTKCFTVWFVVSTHLGEESVEWASFSRERALQHAKTYRKQIGGKCVTRPVRCHVPLKRKGDKRRG
jgi:uncharacterized protein (DUF433 family)